MSTPATKKTAAKKQVGPPANLGAIRPGSNRSREVETWLLESGVSEIDYNEALPVSEINYDVSLQNQARLKAIDPVVVERYKQAMRNGDQFPPIVLYKRARRYVIVDGIHRAVGARDAELETLDVYIITAPSKVLAMLTMTANAKHGMPTNVDERALHAIALMDSGMSQPAAASAVGITLADLKKRYRKVQADRRASNVGILTSDWDKLTEGVKDRLQFINTDEGFEGAVRLCIEAGVDTNEVHALVTELNETKSARAQEKVLETYRDGWRERIALNASGKLTRGKTKAVGPRGRFVLALGQIGAIPEDPSALVSTFVGPEREEMAKKIKAQITKLNAIAKALQS